MFAVKFAGTRYDIGDRYLWLRTNLEFAMKNSELAPRLRPLLRELSSG